MRIASAGYEAALENVLALMPPLEPVQACVAREIYRGIAGQGRVTVEKLAQEVGLPVGLLRDHLADAPGIFYDDQGAIQGFWGLTAEPVSSHRLQVAGADLYTWCAWDALFIPELLGESARIVAKCAATGTPVTMDVHPDRLENVDPAETMVTMRVPADAEFTADILGSFCHHVFFFSSERTAIQWAGDRTDLLFLTVLEAFELGREKNRRQFGCRPGMSWDSTSRAE